MPYVPSINNPEIQQLAKVVDNIADIIGITQGEVSVMRIKGVLKRLGIKDNLSYLTDSVFESKEKIEQCCKHLEILHRRLKQISTKYDSSNTVEKNQLIAIYNLYIAIIPLLSRLNPSVLEDDFTMAHFLDLFPQPSIKDLEIHLTDRLQVYHYFNDLIDELSKRNLNFWMNVNYDNLNLEALVTDRVKRNEIQQRYNILRKYPKTWQEMRNYMRVELHTPTLLDSYKTLALQALSDITDPEDFKFIMNEMRSMVQNKCDPAYHNNLFLFAKMLETANELRKKLSQTVHKNKTEEKKIHAYNNIYFVEENGEVKIEFTPDIDILGNSTYETIIKNIQQEIDTHDQKVINKNKSIKRKIAQLQELITELEELIASDVTENLDEYAKINGKTIAEFCLEQTKVEVIIDAIEVNIAAVNKKIVEKKQFLSNEKQAIVDLLNKEKKFVKKIHYLNNIDTRQNRAVPNQDILKMDRTRRLNRITNIPLLSIDVIQKVKQECEQSLAQIETLFNAVETACFNDKKAKLEQLIQEIKTLLAPYVENLDSLNGYLEAMEESLKILKEITCTSVYGDLVNDINYQLGLWIENLNNLKTKQKNTIESIDKLRNELIKKVSDLNAKRLKLKKTEENLQAKSNQFDGIEQSIKTLIAHNPLDYESIQNKKENEQTNSTESKPFRYVVIDTIKSKNLAQTNNLRKIYINCIAEINKTIATIEAKQKEVELLVAKETAIEKANKESELNAAKTRIKISLAKLIELQTKFTVTKVSPKSDIFVNHALIICDVTGGRVLTDIVGIDTMLKKFGSDLKELEFYEVNVKKAIDVAEVALKLAITTQLKDKIDNYNQKMAALKLKLAGTDFSVSKGCQDAVENFTIYLGKLDFSTKPLNPCLESVANGLTMHNGRGFNQAWENIESKFILAIQAIENELTIFEHRYENTYQKEKTEEQRTKLKDEKSIKQEIKQKKSQLNTKNTNTARHDYETELQKLKALQDRFIKIQNLMDIPNQSAKDALSKAILNIEAKNNETHYYEAIKEIEEEKTALEDGINEALSNLIAEALKPYYKALELTPDELSEAKVPKAVKDLFNLLLLASPNKLTEPVVDVNVMARAKDKEFNQFITHFKDYIIKAASAIDDEKKRLQQLVQQAEAAAERARVKRDQENQIKKQNDLIKKTKDENEKTRKLEEQKRIKREQIEKDKQKQLKEEQEKIQKEEERKAEALKKIEAAKRKQGEERKQLEDESRHREEQESIERENEKKATKRMEFEQNQALNQEEEQPKHLDTKRQPQEEKNETKKDIIKEPAVEEKKEQDENKVDGEIFEDKTVDKEKALDGISLLKCPQLMQVKILFENLEQQINAQLHFNIDARFTLELLKKSLTSIKNKQLKNQVFFDINDHLAEIKKDFDSTMAEVKRLAQKESFSFKRFFQVFFGLGNKVNIKGQQVEIKHSNTMKFLQTLEEQFNDKIKQLQSANVKKSSLSYTVMNDALNDTVPAGDEPEFGEPAGRNKIKTNNVENSAFKLEKNFNPDIIKAGYSKLYGTNKQNAQRLPYVFDPTKLGLTS